MRNAAFFELAVIGPIAGNRMGLIRECIGCRQAVRQDAFRCSGFGPGCIAGPRVPQDRRTITSRSR